MVGYIQEISYHDDETGRVWCKCEGFGMKVKNNIEYDIDNLEQQIQEQVKKQEEDGNIFYGLLMHPQTYRDIVTSENYSQKYFASPILTHLFFYKVITDPSMYQNELDILVKVKT